MTALAHPPAHVPARRSPGFVADRAMQLAARTFEIEARALLGLATVLPAIRRVSVTLAAMTGRPEPTLGQHDDRVLVSAVDKETCPLQLAPTASTTAQTAPGDALAVALLDARGSRDDDFARSHPGGSPGRKLLERVRDVMEQHRVTSRLVVAAQGVRLGALNSNNLMRAKVI